MERGDRRSAYGARSGVLGVARQSPRRTPKPSARWPSTPPRGSRNGSWSGLRLLRVRAGTRRRRVVKSRRLASHTQDDGFHEIQLNGKQLVFLFMAATVVSVVIFLCGVLVGRGVRAGRGTAVETVALADPTPVELSPAESPRVSAPRAGQPVEAPKPGNDELSYFNRLEQPNPPVEELTAKATPAPAPAKPERPRLRLRRRNASPPRLRRLPPASGAAAPQDAATQPFAVQIAALNVRSEADAMAKRLSSKGYAAFVLPPANGTRRSIASASVRSIRGARRTASPSDCRRKSSSSPGSLADLHSVRVRAGRCVWCSAGAQLSPLRSPGLQLDRAHAAASGAR